MIYCHRKKHKPNVCLATWQVNTYNDILLELLRVSCTFSPNSWGLWFFYSCRSFFFVWQTPPNGCSCGVEPFQQASLMQGTFPIFCSKFPLFGDWLNIDDFTLPVIMSCPASLLSLSFVSACLPSFSPLTSSLPFFLVLSFNFMPPALALGPLASARMALWHTAYQLPWGIGGAPLFLTHKHTQTQMCSLLAPGLSIGIHAELMAINPSRKLIWRAHKDTCCRRRDHMSERSDVLAQLRLLKNKKPLFPPWIYHICLF